MKDSVLESFKGVVINTDGNEGIIVHLGVDSIAGPFFITAATSFGNNMGNREGIKSLMPGMSIDVQVKGNVVKFAAPNYK